MKKFAFFGTPLFAEIVLDELKAKGFVPSLIVTVEDKPKGRKLVLTPPEVKVWAEKESVPYLQLKTLRDAEVVEKIKSFSPDGFDPGTRAEHGTGWDFFVVASYGKMIPQNVLDIPKLGTLNVHPSLLPKLRGASPIESAILSESETGVTIIRLDAEMDHGPIIAQEQTAIDEWPPYFETLETTLAHHGGKLLADILSDWVDGKIEEKEQDHHSTTVCGKIKKEDGLLDLDADPELNLRKIRAYHVWPTAYFFQDGKRIIVKRAHIENSELIIDRIVPEGKNEMDYSSYKNN